MYSTSPSLASITLSALVKSGEPSQTDGSKKIKVKVKVKVKGRDLIDTSKLTQFKAMCDC